MEILLGFQPLIYCSFWHTNRCSRWCATMGYTYGRFIPYLEIDAGSQPVKTVLNNLEPEHIVESTWKAADATIRMRLNLR